MTEDDDVIYLDAPPPPAQRIAELHVWVATYPDGSEGIISADLPTAEGPRHMPLMSSKRHVAEALEPIVRKVQRIAASRAERMVTVRLVVYRAGT